MKIATAEHCLELGPLAGQFATVCVLSGVK